MFDDGSDFPNIPRNDNRDAQISLALETFTDKYEPAGKFEVTDYFTSAEITSIINSHTGIDATVSEIAELLQSMDYKYELEDGEFRWMVKKTN